MPKATTTKSVPLMVTTAHKGVFFGYGEQTNAAEIRIEKARMCVYWAGDVRGVLGLAATGPSKSCKITAAVPSILLKDVTSVMEVSKEAAEAWEKAPWS